MRTIKWGDSRLPARFWIKTRVNPQTGCWEWINPLDKDGYAHFRLAGSPTRIAHRIAYLVLVGPVPEATLNHDCRIRHCVNPNRGHAATPMSSANNVREGKARITHCPHGHAYTEANTMMTGPTKRSRACRTCYNAKSKKYWRTTQRHREKEARRTAGYRGSVAETATCKYGHPRTKKNTYTTPSGYKTCRVCRHERSTAYNKVGRAK